MRLHIQPPVIAHRGASAYAPENTMIAFEKAHDLGIKWVEFDVMQAACGEPIIFHDETLDRTTNAQGQIGIHPYHYLRTLDAGTWFDRRFEGQYIPTLHELMRWLQKNAMSANVEIKPLPGADESTALASLKMIETIFPQPHPAILFSSFSVASLACLRQHSPHCQLGLLVDHWDMDWENITFQLNCVSLHVDEAIMTKEIANKIKSLGKILLCYTVNDPDRARELYSWGVDAVFSDMPDRILTL